MVANLIERTLKFRDEINTLKFSFDGYVYNPLDYGKKMHLLYLEKYVNHGVKALFLGMNPGPFGMAQTAVPFGEVNLVKEWMQLNKKVGKPAKEHPARPILGLEVERSEISGLRFWSLMRDRFGAATSFFKQFAVMNYCPLVFVDSGKTGKNIIPEKLPKDELNNLENVCDAYLDDIVKLIEPQNLIGIGRYAEKKLLSAKERINVNIPVYSILHPSPSNPRANSGWSAIASSQLEEFGIW